MPSRLTRFADWLLTKAAPTLLQPRWGGRRAIQHFLGGGNSVGQWTNQWTESRYQQVRHFKHWVYIAVDRVATEVAMHMPNVSLLHEAGEPDPMRKYLPKSFTHTRAITPLQSHERLEPVRGSHPLYRLLRDPNEPDTSFDLWYETTMFLMLTGSAYWWAPRNPVTQKPAALWVIPSHWVYSQANEDGWVEKYEIRPIEGNYVRMVIPADDMIYFRKKSPVSKLDGYSPQQAGAQWIDTIESVDRTRWFSFKNGIFPGVSVEFDHNIKLPDESDLNRIEARLMSRYGQEHNANKPIMVPPGAKLRKLQLSADELGFFDSANQLRDNVLSLFHVPGPCVGVVADMTFGSLRASMAGLYTGAINPLFHFYGQNVTEKLAAPRYDRRLRVWWEDRTPADPELRETSLMTDLAYGAKTMNEVRALRGDEPYPHAWANEPWMPMNTVPVSMALKGFSGNAGGGSPGANRETVTDPANHPRRED